jgi:hypothetical protein
LQDAEPPPARRAIVRDEGPGPGGASTTQKVVIAGEDGLEVPAYAKFGRDTAGGIIAENGERGLASELLTAELAVVIGASTPLVEAIDYAAPADVTLSAGRKPAYGVAVASHTIQPAIDVNASDALKGVPKEELACIAVLHSWAEVSDRGHNLIRSHDRAFSIDHATAFASAWNAVDPPGTFALDGLLGPVLAGEDTVIRAAADRLEGVADVVIDQIVDQVPRELVPSDDIRNRLKSNLKLSRDRVVAAVRLSYPGGAQS